MSKILVVGSSGLVGTALVKELKTKGHTVRGTTSKREGSGHDVAYLDLTTGEGLNAAFEGIDRAFFLSPPGYVDQYAMLSPLIQEAKRRGLEKVVLMTAMGANASDSTPFRRAEIELEKSGLTYNIIRPNWFLQNFNTFWSHDIKTAGAIKLPAGSAKTSFIDARDISAVAARLLTSAEFDNRDLDLTGPQAVDHAEVARAISASTGRRVGYQEITPEAFKATLLGFGLPAAYVDFMVLIIGFLREGYNAGVSGNVKAVLGRDPISLSKYAEDYKNSL